MKLLLQPFTHAEICPDDYELYTCPPAIKSKSDKVFICHRTASKVVPWIQLEVSQSAVQAHLDHGDFIGDCEQANGPDFVAPDPNFVTNDRKNGNDPNNEPNYGNSGKRRLATCTQQYDPNCSKITGGCHPKLVISADKLRDYTEGPTETQMIGNLLTSSPKMSSYVIDESTWPCLWDKIIDKHEGPQSYPTDLGGPNFSAGMLELMIEEVTRVRDKYSQSPWTDDTNAKRLVELMAEHLVMLNTELGEVNSNERSLTAKCIFAPGERMDKTAYPTA